MRESAMLIASTRAAEHPHQARTFLAAFDDALQGIYKRVKCWQLSPVGVCRLALRVLKTAANELSQQANIQIKKKNNRV